MRSRTALSPRIPTRRFPSCRTRGRGASTSSSSRAGRIRFPTTGRSRRGSVGRLRRPCGLRRAGARCRSADSFTTDRTADATSRPSFSRASPSPSRRCRRARERSASDAPRRRRRRARRARSGRGGRRSPRALRTSSRCGANGARGSSRTSSRGRSKASRRDAWRGRCISTRSQISSARRARSRTRRRR